MGSSCGLGFRPGRRFRTTLKNVVFFPGWAGRNARAAIEFSRCVLYRRRCGSSSSWGCLADGFGWIRVAESGRGLDSNGLCRENSGALGRGVGVCSGNVQQLRGR